MIGTLGGWEVKRHKGLYVGGGQELEYCVLPLNPELER